MQKKKLKNNTPVFQQILSPEDRSNQILEGVDYKSVFLPKPVSLDDIDIVVFNDFETGNFRLIVEDELDGRESVPIIFMTNERWGEFTKTWKMMDQDKNILPPYITIRRLPNTKRGTYAGIKASIPNRKVFTYEKVPFYENGRYGYDLYKIPQPIAVDLQYEITLFSKYMEDVNLFQASFLKNYNCIQYYFSFNGHYFRSECEDDFDDDGTMNDFDGDRFYKPMQTITVKAYLMDETEFQIVKSYNRTVITTKTTDGDIINKDIV